MFSCEFYKISKNIFSIEHLQTTASVNMKIQHKFEFQVPRFFLLNVYHIFYMLIRDFLHISTFPV